MTPLPIHEDGSGQIRRLGTIPPPEGKRLMGVSDLPLLPEKEWREFDYRKQANPIKIKNQGSHGACVGHATASALEWSRWIVGTTHIDLSAWYLYAILCRGIDRGASISEALDLAQEGTCPDEAVEHGTINPNKLSPEAHAAAPKYRIELGSATPTFEHMMSETQRGRFGNFSIGVGNRFNNLDKDGVPPSTSNLNHSVMYGLAAFRDSNGEWLIGCQNSWDYSWGMNGFFNIRKSNIYRGNDSWSIAIPADTPGDTLNPPVAPPRT